MVYFGQAVLPVIRQKELEMASGLAIAQRS
jgi:hypothetical protein